MGSFLIGVLLVAACAKDRALQPLNAAGPLDGGGPTDAGLSDGRSTASGQRSESVCDGSDGVALALYVRPQFGRQPGASVAIELGAGFLYVDGHCSYWVWKTNELDAFRRGSLAAADLERMLAELAFDDWSAEPQRFDEGGGDLPYHAFYSRSRAFLCQGGCPSAPVWARQAYQSAIRWRETLWAEAERMLDVNMRVAPYTEDAQDFTAQYGQQATPWPFAVAPEATRRWVQSPNEPGTGYLVSESAALEAVRSERNNARQRNSASALWFGPYEARYYGFSAREVLPIENEQGLVPEPAFLQALGE